MWARDGATCVAVTLGTPNRASIWEPEARLQSISRSGECAVLWCGVVYAMRCCGVLAVHVLCYAICSVLAVHVLCYAYLRNVQQFIYCASVCFWKQHTTHCKQLLLSNTDMCVGWFEPRQHTCRTHCVNLYNVLFETYTHRSAKLIVKQEHLSQRDPLFKNIIKTYILFACSN